MSLTEFIQEYARLVANNDWDGLVDFIRLKSINTSKEVLLSTNPDLQRLLHETLRKTQ